VLKSIKVKILIKILFTALAFWYVLSKVDVVDVVELMKRVDIYYLFLSLISFNISKIISSIRLNILFKLLGIDLGELRALKLYYVGMFYNLSLPGGIGGDGYKIYLLNRAYGSSISELLKATFLDRVSGLVPLLIFAGVIFLFSDYRQKIGEFTSLTLFITVTFVPLPSLWLLYRYIFKRFYKAFLSTSILGFATQAFQILSAYFIAKAVLIEENFLLETILLFLISSLIAVLPISFGGVGVREGVFLYGLTLLNTSPDKGVTFGLIFFIITALSSFVGLFLRTDTD
jgi:uncharacterized membrane protein YbhN (UPF0104 family)